MLHGRGHYVYPILAKRVRYERGRPGAGTLARATCFRPALPPGALTARGAMRVLKTKTHVWFIRAAVVGAVLVLALAAGAHA